MKATKRLYAAVGKVGGERGEILTDERGAVLVNSNKAELVDLANDRWAEDDYYIKVYTSA